MKIKKSTSLVVAENIINLLQNTEHPSSLNGVSFSIESYQNGREQGFLLWAFYYENNGNIKPLNRNVNYYICQARKSDSICIYKGEYAMQSISDSAYKNPTYFDYENYSATVNWLIEDIQKEVSILK